MTLVRHILCFCTAMLLSVFGTNMAFAVPISASDITYFQTETVHIAQADDVGFAARAPPLATVNVGVTGGVIVMQGGAVALHRQETVAALFGFDDNFIVPNSGGRITNIYGPLNKGPLPNDIAGTFRSGTYSEVITTEPTKLYRVISDSGNPAGGYWTRTKPMGPLQSVIDSALDQNWGAMPKSW